MASFKERKNIKLNQLSNDILKIWEEENTFKKSIENSQGIKANNPNLHGISKINGSILNSKFSFKP